MPQSITCPKCRSAFSVSSKQLGKPVKCPRCSRDFTPPAPSGKSAQGVPAKTVPAGKSAQGVAAKPVATGKSAQGVAAKPAPRHSAKPSESAFPGADGNLVSLAPGLRRPPGRVALFMKRLKRICMIFLIVAVVGGGLTFLAIKFEPWNLLFASRDTSKDTAVASPTAPTTTSKEQPVDPETMFNASTGREELLAYVPPDASLIIGFDTAAIQRDPLLKPFFDRQLVSLGMVTTLADAKTQTGLDVTQLFERVIVAFGPAEAGKQGSMTLVVQSSLPFHQPKLGTWASAKPPKKFQDRYFYEGHKELPLVRCVYMPSNRIVVLSEYQPPQLAALFSTDGSKLSLPPEIVTLVRQVEKNQAWAVMPFAASTRAELKAGKGLAEFIALFTPQNIQATVNKVLPEARAITFRTTLQQGPIDIGIGLACSDKKSADELLRAVQNSWNQLKVKKLKQVHNSVVLESMERQMLVKSLADNLQFGQQDLLLEITSKTTMDALKPMLQDGPDAFATQAYEVAGIVTNELGLKLLPERTVVLTADEKAFLDRVNELRKAGMVPLYKPNIKLMEVARTHAVQMAKEEKLDDELGGKDTIIRVKDVAYRYKKEKLRFNLGVGDNLAPAKAVDEWAKDELRKELLFGEFDETGIGIAKSETGKVYFYQIYAEPER